MNYRIAIILLTALLWTGCKTAEQQDRSRRGTVLTAANPPAGGQVSGGGTYPSGQVISISATANPNWSFDSWQNGTTNNPLQWVVRRGTYTVVASFLTNAPPTYGNLVLTAEPPAGGTVSGSGTYVVGQNVQISATASPNWHFWHWQDGNPDNPRMVVVPAGTLLATASFATNEVATGSLSGAAVPGEGGTVSGGGTFPVGSNARLTAMPAANWGFDKWYDGVTTPQHDFTISSGNFTATAYFAQFGTISLVSEPINGGTTAGAGTYKAGQTISITATPASGWNFVQWQDGNTSRNRQVTVPVGTVIYSATFVTNTPPASGGGAQISWPTVTGAASYVLRWGTSPGVFSSLSTNGTSATVLGLATNLTWYWSVVSVGPDGSLSEPGCEVAWRYGQSNVCGAF